MNVEGMIWTESMSAWAVTPTKNNQIKFLKPHAHFCIIGRKSTKFQMNPMKDVEGVEKTRFLICKAYVSMGNNSVKNSSIKNPKPHVHLHITGRKSTKFQMNPMKDVEGVAETRSWLAKFKSPWAITPSKIVESKF